MSRATDVLWGKSNAAGSVNLLLQHLLDTAAVAELIWDYYFAPVVRQRINAWCSGRGRELFALFCVFHDVGKASPAFQSKVPELATRVQGAGLTWRSVPEQEMRKWHHTLAGAVIVQRVLGNAGWDNAAVQLVWPLIAGHHGVVPNAGALRPRGGLARVQGAGPWESAQDELVSMAIAALDLDLAQLVPAPMPRRAEQLALLGGVIMADWLASDERHFPGVPTAADVSMSRARHRAAAGWSRLGLRGGWDPCRIPATTDPIKARFNVTARPGQAALVELAERMPAPGLLILEAPMGEGKTEAALAAVEVLARRFGADGVFVGMPTQATSDPMFTRVREWALSVQPGLQVGLLHGKRRFNKDWQELLGTARFNGVDEYGCADEYGGSAETRLVPAEWLLGHKRGLLMPLVVGTVDHLLHAATRTRHVMLRHVGLAGRVVVLDEVHAYDIYMEQFLAEALRWLADGGVPVVLLSATLTPRMRADLARAYVQGATGVRDVVPQLPEPNGYPNALAVCVTKDKTWVGARCSASWRASVPVRVDVLDERPNEMPVQVTELLADALRDGGCALVIHNTVRRAQQTYLAVREVFGADSVLLHARLAMGERTDRTEALLRQLGRDGYRPRRLVVVATQLAEQSFDVDADLLVTDLAPVDLLLQRMGRLHRHERTGRPAPVATPRAVITGMARQTDAPPWLPPGSRTVYGDHLLLRAAALVMSSGGEWSIPAEVPSLVARGYGPDMITPLAWTDTVEAAAIAWEQSLAKRRSNAERFLLAGEDLLGTPTLAGLHDLSVGDLPNDEAVAAVVRDGEPSVEVVLVRHDGRNYLTLDGRSIGPNGAAVSDGDVLERVLRFTIRLPAHPDLTAAAERDLRPLAGWAGDPWLSRARALPLDTALSADLASHRLSYDTELGLLHQPPRGASSATPAKAGTTFSSDVVTDDPGTGQAEPAYLGTPQRNT